MGDDINEEFTAEELEILGEAEPQDEGPETPETDEEAAGEAEGQETETEQSTDDETEAGEAEEESEEEAEEQGPVPQDRFNQVYGRAKETERKLDLLKRLGPEEYYKVYPDERPADSGGDKPGEGDVTEQPANRVPTFSECQSMTIQGGAYDGQTLGDLYRTDPMAATDMYLAYRDEQRDAIAAKAADEEKVKQEAAAEIDAFESKLAVEMFGKEKAQLGTDESKKIEAAVDSIQSWMQEQDGWGYKLEHAWLIMNHEKLLAGAKSEGAKAFANQLKGGSTPSVRANRGSGGKKTGFEAYEQMSRNELAATIEGMSDSQFAAFEAKAPQSLKDKYPDIFI